MNAQGQVLSPSLEHSNGPASVHPAGIAVLTGISTEAVRVSIDPRTHPPDTDDEDEDVGDVSVHAPVGRMLISGVFNDAPHCRP